VLVTEWSQFRALNFAHLRSIMRSPTIIDPRNISRVEDLVTHGFPYCRISAPQLVPSLSFDRRDWLARAHPRQRNGGAERRSNGSAACPPRRKQLAGVREAGSARSPRIVMMIGREIDPAQDRIIPSPIAPMARMRTMQIKIQACPGP